MRQQKRDVVIEYRGPAARGKRQSRCDIFMVQSFIFFLNVTAPAAFSALKKLRAFF